MKKLQPLSLYNSDFSSIRHKNRIYVDKTDLLYELADPDAEGWYFLSRPRRFGKSLLLSTFYELFQNGLADFDGLKIERLWNDGTYRVLRLNFAWLKSVNSRTQFLRAFNQMMVVSCRNAGIPFNCSEDIDDAYRLGLFLSSMPPNSLVVLIDEYDAPLTSNMHDEAAFEDVRKGMSDIFEQIKECQRSIRFFFMTGITKISQAGIFSGFNNMRDISLLRKYGTLLGYTEEEISQYFGDYLERAARVGSADVREILERIRENYDGYCFDEATATHVYSPWSVMSYLTAPEDGFKCYWYNSAGKPSIVENLLRRQGMLDVSILEKQQTINIRNLLGSHGLMDMDPLALLYQSGYLTMKRIIGEQVFLDFPNKEVRRSMEDLYFSLLIDDGGQRNLQFERIVPYMRSGNAEGVVRLLNLLMLEADYGDAAKINSEGICRFCVYISLRTIGLSPRPEGHNAFGRSDLELDVGSVRWIFEFKYAEKQADVERKLREAADQITARRYGEARLDDRHLIRVALVYCAEKRQFFDRVVDDSQHPQEKKGVD